MDGKVDVIVLSQYSMAHVANQVTPSTPILVAPEATAKRCFQYILQNDLRNKHNHCLFLLFTKLLYCSFLLRNVCIDTDSNEATYSQGMINSYSSCSLFSSFKH